MADADPRDTAERTRAVLREWNGYDPTEDEARRLDEELDRRLAQAMEQPGRGPGTP
ncbi:hypothetical protein [Streptomyces radiopugnans]|uniref:hypothetical protein n=1 Tax=Streptomyces radiopugnans TaxID=403935 RepID=UPI003F1D2CE6